MKKIANTETTAAQLDGVRKELVRDVLTGKAIEDIVRELNNDIRSRCGWELVVDFAEGWLKDDDFLEDVYDAADGPELAVCSYEPVDLSPNPEIKLTNMANGKLKRLPNGFAIYVDDDSGYDLWDYADWFGAVSQKDVELIPVDDLEDRLATSGD